MHDSVITDSLQFCLWQVQIHWRHSPTMHMAKLEEISASNLLTTEEMSKWKHLLKIIFWFTIEWAKTDTNTEFSKIFKEKQRVDF